MLQMTIHTGTRTPSVTWTTSRTHQICGMLRSYTGIYLPYLYVICTRCGAPQVRGMVRSYGCMYRVYLGNRQHGGRYERTGICIYTSDLDLTCISTVFYMLPYGYTICLYVIWTKEGTPQVWGMLRSDIRVPMYLRPCL